MGGESSRNEGGEKLKSETGCGAGREARTYSTAASISTFSRWQAGCGGKALFSSALGLKVARDDGTHLPGRGGNEHSLVQEERTPFLGIGPVGSGAAEELEFPVEAFHEPGIAKQGDEVAFVPEEPTDWIYFHGPSLAGGVGQIRG